LALLPLLGLLAAAAADAEAPETVLARMRQAQANVRSLVANLEQVKSYPQLGIEDPPETGSFYLTRQRGRTRLKMEIRTPETRILRVQDGEYLLYQPRIKQAVEGKLAGGGKKGLFSGLLTGSPEAMEELDADYDAEGLGEAILSGMTVVKLRFTAKPGAEVYCGRIELSIDTTLWLPVQQSCHEANQNVITFTLDDIKLNVPMDKDVFEVELPAGVERLRG